MTKAPVRLTDLFKYYKNLPHQQAALHLLEEAIFKADESLMGRDQEWFKVWSQSGKQPESDLKPAFDIIRKWEGCRLVGYLCPSGIATIGYGHTGAGVSVGQKITQADADALLRSDIERFAKAVDHQIRVQLNNNQRCALISFAFNVGTNALFSSTLRRRLNNGENPQKVAMEELPKWNKGNGEILEGLVRRRRDELDLFLAGTKPLTDDNKLTPNKPYYFKVTPHITYGELCNDEEERRFVHQYQCDVMSELICPFLERVREKFNGPIIITSGHRPPKMNARIGGASRSEHLMDAPETGAVDFYVVGANIHAVQAWVDANWPYSVGYGAPKGFIHLGVRPGRPRVRWNY